VGQPIIFAEILEVHAEEAAFLWRIRDAAATAPHYDRASLAVLDERIEAHLDGLRIAGKQGLEVATKALVADEPGTVFTLAALAAERAEAKAFGDALALAAESTAAARAVTSALAWAPFHIARPLLGPLLSARAPATHRRIGIAASAAHREDPGEPLAYAILDDEPRLRARGLRAAGELGRADLAGELRAELGRDGNDDTRFWSAWSAALLGLDGAMPALWALADAGGPFAERACALVMRRIDPREGRGRLESRGAVPAPDGDAGSPRPRPGSAVAERARTAIAGACALGDPALVPWLLEAMETPELARVAGEAFATITGALVEGPLEAKPPEGFVAGPNDDPDDSDVAIDRDWALRWPAAKAAAAWWSARENDFRRGVRYLLGAPLTTDALDRVLAQGSQRQRAAAAIELALRRPGHPLLEVRARAWQAVTMGPQAAPNPGTMGPQAAADAGSLREAPT
jgi:uncharacterized protein (TIGR02270 family)